MAEYASTAADARPEVIIAGAGGAAHLPGMVAAQTVLPVIGVPVQSAALNGLDSLLSIVQMPKGVPVATVAIGAVGRRQRRPARGRHPRDVAARAAREAARRTATRSPPRSAAADRSRESIARSRPARRSACSAAASSAACSRWRRAASAIASTRSRPSTTRPTGQIADVEINASYDDLDAVRAFAQARRRRHLRVRERVGGGRRRGRAARDRPAERPRAGDRAARLKEKTFLAEHGLPVAPFAPVRTDADLAAGDRRVGCPAVLKTATLGYDGKGQIRIDAPDDLAAAWDDARPPRSGARGVHRSRARDLGDRRARRRRRVVALRPDRERARAPHPRRVGGAGERARRRSPRRPSTSPDA